MIHIPQSLVERMAHANARLDRARTAWQRARSNGEDRFYVAYLEAQKLWIETDAEILKHENKALRRALRKAAPGHPLCEVV